MQDKDTRKDEKERKYIQIKQEVNFSLNDNWQ